VSAHPFPEPDVDEEATQEYFYAPLAPLAQAVTTAAAAVSELAAVSSNPRPLTAREQVARFLRQLANVLEGVK
jgi:hypothetical protein